MTFAEYQAAANRTANNETPSDMRRLVAAGALCEEAGELFGVVKKIIAHGHPANLSKLSEELGDLLWYAADFCQAWGLSLDDVALANIAKLKRRYPEGFSQQASIKRVDANA